MTWTHRTENLCKARPFGAWNYAMRLELTSSLAFAMLLATGAVAQESAQMPPRGGHPACAERTKIVAALAAKYREVPIALAIQSNGLLFEIFATTDGSTWSAVTTSPQTNHSCIVGAGTHWTSVPAVAADTGDGL